MEPSSIVRLNDLQYNTEGLGFVIYNLPDTNKEEQQHIKITAALTLVVLAMVVSQSADGN